jgi:uncharacterized membrane protein
MMALALTLHMLFVVIWVGGMFFAYMALRPVAASLLEPPLRLQLWAGVFARFFPWVWGAVALILASGLWIVLFYYNGMANVSAAVHTMFGLGLVMMLIFMHVFFAPYGRLKKAVAAQDWPAGGKALGQIRMLIGINLSIGLIVVVIAVAGRYGFFGA